MKAIQWENRTYNLDEMSLAELTDLLQTLDACLAFNAAAYLDGEISKAALDSTARIAARVSRKVEAA